MSTDESDLGGWIKNYIDSHFASGAKIDFNRGDITMSHASSDCPTCNQPVYNVQGAIAEMIGLKAEIKRLKKERSVLIDIVKSADVCEDCDASNNAFCCNDMKDRIMRQLQVFIDANHMDI